MRAEYDQQDSRQTGAPWNPYTVEDHPRQWHQENISPHQYPQHAQNAQQYNKAQVVVDLEDVKQLFTNKKVLVPNLKIFLAEFIGTAALLFVGCLGAPSGRAPVTFGLAIILIAQMFGHVSGGHVNLAVSIAALISGEITFLSFPFYFLGQLFGALAGYGCLWYLSDYFQLYPMCATDVAVTLRPVQGMFIELLATMLLVLVLCGIWDKNHQNGGDSGPVKIGLLVLGLILATEPYTSASINSLRSLAPAIFHDTWNNHWVYWVGPNLGGVIGAVVYRFLIKN